MAVVLAALAAPKPKMTADVFFRKLGGTLALGICSASAITYEFNGKIDRVVDALDPYGIRVGTPFHGYLSFDLETLIPSIKLSEEGLLLIHPQPRKVEVVVG